jgi:hypothetical protein
MEYVYGLITVRKYDHEADLRSQVLVIGEGGVCKY